MKHTFWQKFLLNFFWFEKLAAVFLLRILPPTFPSQSPANCPFRPNLLSTIVSSIHSNSNWNLLLQSYFSSNIGKSSPREKTGCLQLFIGFLCFPWTQFLCFLCYALFHLSYFSDQNQALTWLWLLPTFDILMIAMARDIVYWEITHNLPKWYVPQKTIWNYEQTDSLPWPNNS